MNKSIAFIFLLTLVVACEQKTPEQKTLLVENFNVPPSQDLLRYCARFTLSECPTQHCVSRAHCPNCETTCQPKTEADKQEEQRQREIIRFNCREYTAENCIVPPCIVSPSCFNCNDSGCFSPMHIVQLEQDKKEYETSQEAPICEQQGGKWFYFNNGCADSCSTAHATGPVMCTQNMNWGCECGPDKCWNGTGCEPNQVSSESSLNCTGYTPENCPRDSCVSSPSCLDCMDVTCMSQAERLKIEQEAIQQEQQSPRAQECRARRGNWTLFGSGCVDDCWAARWNSTRDGSLACEAAFTWGCDCGPDKCWNKDHCEKI